MIWDAARLRKLDDIVNRKFDEFQHELPDSGSGQERRKVLGRWTEYLSEHGIIRRPFQFKKQSGKEPCVWIECPWSVRYSTPGAAYTKSELFFPMDLAEKIVILEWMP